MGTEIGTLLPGLRPGQAYLPPSQFQTVPSFIPSVSLIFRAFAIPPYLPVLSTVPRYVPRYEGYIFFYTPYLVGGVKFELSDTVGGDPTSLVLNEHTVFDQLLDDAYCLISTEVCSLADSVH